MDDRDLRDHLANALGWGDAHATFDKAIDGVPDASRGTRPAGWPHSPWELVEHLRLTQRDILEFCRNPDYEDLEWPADYWPTSATPPSAAAWEESIRGYREDMKALQALARDETIDLNARIPHGDGQTYLRELLLVIDHTAYHVGQLVAVRRALGVWPIE